MDLGKITLFAATRERMAWLNQRQEVLARNIANADTPHFRPSDVEAFRARTPLATHDGAVGRGRLTMNTTAGGHLSGRGAAGAGAASERRERRPYETAPDGNAVVLEEQMAKANETAMTHKLVSELYRKHMGMFRMALGSGR